jgi:hypothetical protein
LNKTANPRRVAPDLLPTAVNSWLGMTYLALDQEEDARIAIEQALALDMPPILLRPLTWFEQEKPKRYEKFVKPLLTTYGVDS